MLSPSCNDNDGVMMNQEQPGLSPEPTRKTRVHRSEKSSRGIFARHRASGLTIDEFYGVEGIGRSSFNRWQMLLNAKDSFLGRARPAQSDEACASDAGDRFIDAGEMRVDHASEAIEIRLELGGGVLLTIRRG